MKSLFRSLAFSVVSLFILGISGTSLEAGTTIIEVKTEGFGDIHDEVNGSTNLNGAMLWSGTDWVVNSTWAHKFFVDLRTGERLKQYSTLGIFSGTSPEELVLTDTSGMQYKVTKSTYSYSKGESCVFTYEAVKYVLEDMTTGKKVFLLSRGTGNGTRNAYFDVFIDNEAGSGSIAMRGDPVWFQYSVGASEAANLTDPGESRRGNLPGAVSTKGSPSADYYLDIGGGSDMGGKSHELICSGLSNFIGSLSSSYVVQYNLKFTDGNGNLMLITCYPALVSETTSGNCRKAEAVPSINEWGMIVLILLIGIGSVSHIKRRKVHLLRQTSRPND